MSTNARGSLTPLDYRGRPSGFLSLAPNTSATQRSKPSEPAQALTEAALAAIPKKEVLPDTTKRRTSSLSSDESKSGFRFLKLGHPVEGDAKGDFFEVAVE